MIQIDITSNIKKFVAIELRNIQKNINKAVIRTNNDVARGAATAASKDIRKEYNIKAGDLNKSRRIKRASFTDPEAKIISSSKHKGLALAAFGARPTNKGATFAVKKGKRTKLLHSFLAVMKSGHKGLYLREGKEKLPIKERFGPNAPKLYGSKVSIDAIKRYVKVNYDRIYEKNFRFYNNRSTK